MQYPDSRILIFAKAPWPGEVKTRLIPLLGEEGAAALYRELLEGTLSRVCGAPIAPVQCWCAPDVGDSLFQRYAAEWPLELKQQVEGDLGERMFFAARDALGSASSVVLIGGDCPLLDAHYLEHALQWLKAGVDAVVGPAEDGGYVLLGLNRVNPALFQDIAWGSDDVLETTRSRLRVLGWAWRELNTLWDLDRPADLERYGPALKLNLKPTICY